MTNKLTAELFLNDVKEHELTILHDESFFRHIRLSKPNDSNKKFYLTTFPGHLVFSGDMGTFAFRRLHDMFHFFRSTTDCLHINPGYWSEKCEAENRFGNGIKSFSHDLFAEIVNGLAKEFINEGGLKEYASQFGSIKRATKSFLSEINDLIKSTENDYAAHQSMCDYEFLEFDLTATDVFGEDSWEYDFTDYTYHFIWCCYAIQWGIMQYDKFNVDNQEAA